MSTIYRYVTYNAHLPQHALTSVHILDWVCQSPLVQPKIVSLLTSEPRLETTLLPDRWPLLAVTATDLSGNVSAAVTASVAHDCRPPEVERAERARASAQEQLQDRSSEHDFERAELKLKRAMERIRVHGRLR